MSSLHNCSVCTLTFVIERQHQKLNPIWIAVNVDYPIVNTAPDAPGTQTVRFLTIDQTNFKLAWIFRLGICKRTKVKAGPGKGKLRYRPARLVRLYQELTFEQLLRLVPITDPIKLIGDWSINDALSTLDSDVKVAHPKLPPHFTIQLNGYDFDAHQGESQIREFRLIPYTTGANTLFSIHH